jgi:predicted secreted protein
MTNAEFNALVSQDMQRLVAAAQARQAADEQMVAEYEHSYYSEGEY